MEIDRRSNGVALVEKPGEEEGGDDEKQSSDLVSAGARSGVVVTVRTKVSRLTT